MGIVFLRTLLMYIFVVAAVRLMGKRQIGELQLSELVVAILISELAAIPMQATSIPLLAGIVPILTLLAAELMLSFINMKFTPFRKLLSGTPSILIANGVINQREMRRQRFTVDDLMEELRLKNVLTVDDVSYAIVETNGQMSVFLKPRAQTPTLEDLKLARPDPGLSYLLIRDGSVNQQMMDQCGKDMEWLTAKLGERKLHSPKEVFLMTIDDLDNLTIIVKEEEVR